MKSPLLLTIALLLRLIRMTSPFDEQAALDDLLAERYGEQVVVAVDNVDLVEEEESVEAGSELYKELPGGEEGD